MNNAPIDMDSDADEHSYHTARERHGHGPLFEIDDVIAPADTRRWMMAGLTAAPPVSRGAGKKRPWIDAWWLPCLARRP